MHEGVPVQPARGIDPLGQAEIRQSPVTRQGGELAHHAVGLIEEDDHVGVPALSSGRDVGDPLAHHPAAQGPVRQMLDRLPSRLCLRLAFRQL